MQIDHIALDFERTFGALTVAERRALATHMDAAQTEARSAGCDTELVLDLVQLAHSTELAATRQKSSTGLTVW